MSVKIRSITYDEWDKKLESSEEWYAIKHKVYEMSVESQNVPPGSGHHKSIPYYVNGLKYGVIPNDEWDKAIANANPHLPDKYHNILFNEPINKTDKSDKINKVVKSISHFKTSFDLFYTIAWFVGIFIALYLLLQNHAVISIVLGFIFGAMGTKLND
jgi:hypothetical protein